MKVCSGCGEAKSLTEFHKHPLCKMGVKPKCKACCKKLYDDPERAKARDRMRLYGITTQEFEAMIEAQDGCCKICRKPPEKFYVDHDHTTGKVRGLLCIKCNTMLGMAEDRPGTLLSAVDYLTRP